MMSVVGSVSMAVMSVISVTVAVSMGLSLSLVVAVVAIAVVNDLVAVFQPKGLVRLSIPLHQSHSRNNRQQKSLKKIIFSFPR